MHSTRKYEMHRVSIYKYSTNMLPDPKDCEYIQEENPTQPLRKTTKFSVFLNAHTRRANQENNVLDIPIRPMPQSKTVQHSILVSKPKRRRKTPSLNQISKPKDPVQRNQQPFKYSKNHHTIKQNLTSPQSFLFKFKPIISYVP